VTLLPIHVVAGLVAIGAAAVTLFATKGARLHRESGMIFVHAMLVALAMGLAHVSLGVAALQTVTGTKYGYPPPLYFVFGSVALMAAAGDMRMIHLGSLQGRRRIVRHLWRMCFATFIATGSFFLGQAKVFPESIRIVPLLAIPAVAPLVLMLYWLARASGGRRYSRA